MNEKRFGLWRCNEYKNGVVDNSTTPKTYFLDDEVVDLLNNLDEEIDYWKHKALTLLMQVRRLTPRMSNKEIREFNKEISDDNNISTLFSTNFQNQKDHPNNPKEINENEVENLFSDWRILLEECQQGQLKTNWYDKFTWETQMSFDCLVDEVTRLNRVCAFYDLLVKIPTDELLKLIMEHSKIEEWKIDHNIER